MTTFSYTFPAIRGIQAGREYYVSMCPLNLIPKIFLFDEEEVPSEIRAQRLLNKSRVPLMARYLTENPDNYTFSALTASIDGEVEFEAFSDKPQENQLGSLHIPMTSKFIINDGQHRRAAIEEAIKNNPELREETIAIVFFVDTGLSRAQQMFADLNRYAVRPNRSISVLYDHRDPISESVSTMVLNSTFYEKLIDRNTSSLASRSKKLFTLSALYTATKELVDGSIYEKKEELQDFVHDYWHELAALFTPWGEVYNKTRTAGDVRDQYIHSYAVTLQSLGRVGNQILKQEGSAWKKKLVRLKDLDWSRENSMWVGCPVFGGTIRNSAKVVALTTATIKKAINMPLSEDEEKQLSQIIRD